MRHLRLQQPQDGGLSKKMQELRVEQSHYGEVQASHRVSHLLRAWTHRRPLRGGESSGSVGGGAGRKASLVRVLPHDLA